ncbi:MAG: hypothetical protein PHU06_06260 [Gallionella sp.]|nr:hypothetical protein [Gallionella sp.]MDD4958431.1 hypothetical protein [Gallionella sp.]
MSVKWQIGSVWLSQVGELPAIYLGPVEDDVAFLTTELERASHEAFARAYKWAPKELVVPNAKLLLSWALEYGASDRTLAAFQQFIPLSQEQLAMAKAEEAEKTTTAAAPKATAKPAAAPKPAPAPAPAPKEPRTPAAPGTKFTSTVAGRMKQLIMDGKMPDSEILAITAKEFNFDPATKKTYVAFYRRQLTNAGATVPPPVPEKAVPAAAKAEAAAPKASAAKAKK